MASKETPDSFHIDPAVEPGSNDDVEAVVPHQGKYLDIGETHGFTSVLGELPHGYYLSSRFLGSFAAMWFGLAAGVGLFSVASPVLSTINQDLGPSDNYAWIAIAYTLSMAVGQAFVGRLSDILGRRYIFIVGAIFALVGAIVVATAHSINTVIGGMVLGGLGAASQLSYSFALGELVPMKHRFLAIGILFLAILPMSGFGPAIANAAILHTAAKWRTSFYVVAGVDGVSLALYICFYHPPSLREKQGAKQLVALLKELDYVGAFLFTAAIVLFLMGISWGGGLYAWKSAQVITTIIIGFLVGAAFVLWEIYASLKTPFLPLKLFLYKGFSGCVASLALGAGQFYGMSIVWPLMVKEFYSKGEALNGGYLACLIALGYVAGQVSAGLLSRHIGKARIQVIMAFFFGGMFLGLVATCTPTSKSRALGLVFVACYCIGWNEGVTTVLCTFAVHDQQDIGTAGGIAGSMRSLGGGILSTVYVAILTNRLQSTVARRVPAALVKAGLPLSSVPAWLAALTLGKGFGDVPGATPAIDLAGITSYEFASMAAFRTVLLASIAFSGLGVIVNFFVANVDHKMTDGIAATLMHDRTNEEKGKLDN
ncbi:hypothetical protein LTS17_003428 [Exophiala oligosperma]